MNTYINVNAIEDQSIDWSKLKNVPEFPLMVNVTYGELKALGDSAELTVGQQYRITDYVTTTSQENTTSAGHQFDIIVTADSENTLNEKARACLHDGDTYFADSDLNAWEIWYCLDNDNNRFAWADDTSGESKIGTIKPTSGVNASGTYTYDTPISKVIYYGTTYNLEIGVKTMINSGPPIYVTKTNAYTLVVEEGSTGFIASGSGISVYGSHVGKGVIYRMIDEYGNDCPYDFKNIMFKHPKDTTTYPYYYYTFTTLISDVVSDHSFSGCCYNNVIKEYNTTLNKNVFINTNPTSTCYNNSFENDCDGNSFGNNCYNNSFGNECYGNSFENGCNNNSFGNGCNNNSFGDSYYNNSFGNYCKDNSFGNRCNYNSFGNNCYDNSFVDNCLGNSFGNYCNDNSFGNSCNNNSFGNNCSNNSFVDNCLGNSFGNNCNRNSFGNICYNNSFGNNCYNNSFVDNCLGNSFGNYCNDNSFGNYCNYNSFGNYCKSNSFRVGSSTSDNLRDYCNLNKFCDGCNNVILWNSVTASSTNCLQSVNVNLIGYVGSTSTAPYFAEISILQSTRPINVYYNGYTKLAVNYGEKWRHTTSSITLTKDDKHIICDNTSAITITLPTGWNGAEYYIHKRCSTSITITIKTTDSQYISYGAESSTTEQRATTSGNSSLGTSKLIWDPSASEWIRIYMG